MAKLLIIYYSHTGNTEVMAKAIYEGASSAGASVTMKKATDATGADLLDCDAVVFGTPNNFNYMAGTVKDFFDRAWLTVRYNVAKKPYAAFGSSGSRGRECLESIDNICKSFQLKKVSKGIIAKGRPSSDVLKQCKELGKKLTQL